MSAPRFTLDETRAREWLKLAVAAYDYDNGGDGPKPETEGKGELPEIGADWEPRDFGEDYNAEAVVRLAAEAGIIVSPDGTELYFDYGADDDGGYYHFVLYAGPNLRLTSPMEQTRRIGTSDTEGIAAAMDILREAVQSANGVLEALDEYAARR